MNGTAEQNNTLQSAWNDEYMVIKSMKLGVTEGDVRRGWHPKPYQTQVSGSLEVQFERVTFRQSPRGVPASLWAELIRQLEIKPQPQLRRSIISLVAERVVEKHYPLPFKSCDGCDDRVVCETDERCLR